MFPSRRRQLGVQVSQRLFASAYWHYHRRIDAQPDMWNKDGEPCLLVVKNGSATDTTLGRANGALSIVRNYFTDMSVHQTSMEWAIMNYDKNKEEVFFFLKKKSN